MPVILDGFAGTGSATDAFHEHPDYHVVHVESDDDLAAALAADGRDVWHRDMLTVTADELTARYGRIAGVWASPPCTSLSIAAVSRHYRIHDDGTREPVSDAARLGQRLVAHTLELIEALDPDWWVMENPRGTLRKLDLVRDLHRVTVTYCQYGDTRMKPTDLWGRFPAGWVPRPMCSNGDPCHDAAPRGTKMGGTQGVPKGPERARVPDELGRSLLAAVEGEPEPTPGGQPWLPLVT